MKDKSNSQALNIFRLPTKVELTSLLWGQLEEGYDSGRLDAENFGVLRLCREIFSGYMDEFWASDDYKDGGSAWMVDFSCGIVDIADSSLGFKVRLVRESSTSLTWEEGDSPNDRFQLSPCGRFVSDRKTGLDWMRSPVAKSYTWNEAKAIFGINEACAA